MQQWRKNLYTLWAAQLLIFIGMSLVMPFLPLYIQELGVKGFASSARWSGIVFGIPFLFSTFFAPIWGTIGDLYGRKPMILRAMFGASVVITLMGFVKNVHQLLILRALQGILGGFVGPSMALVTTSVPEELLGFSIGFFQTSMIAGGIVGPLFGGILADIMGYRQIFKLTGLCAFISAMTVLVLVKEERRNNLKEGNTYGLRENISFFFHSKELLTIAFSIFVMQFGIMLVEPVLPLFISTLGVKKKVLATVTGLIFSSTGIVNIFATPLWGKRADKKGYKSTLIICMLGASLCYIPHALVRNAYQLGVLRIILGIFSSGVGPSTQSIIAYNVPPERRGGVYGLANSASLLANLIGPATGGVLAGAIGIRSSFLLTSFFVLTSWLLVRAIVKEPVKAFSTASSLNE
jgi:DHA1 family multidrug resistance protein-like MFS transporter